MKIILLCVLFTLSASVAFAQTEQLPDILKPDAASVSIAQQMGASVFKLLPRGKFESNGFRDAQNPLGIRGGGAYYSFATGSHSYNKVPQIELSRDGKFTVGFYGRSYGFIADLGRTDLGAVNADQPETKYFLTYKPSQNEKDISLEYSAVQGRRVGRSTLWRTLSAVPGNTYLLRAISYNEADTVVAFQVLSIDSDGSATIAWKKLAELEKPVFLIHAR